MKPENLIQCPKCEYYSGDNWSQCGGKCPMLGSPYYDENEHSRNYLNHMDGEYTGLVAFDAKETWPEFVDITTIDDDRIYRVYVGDR